MNHYVSNKWQIAFTAPEGWNIRPAAAESWPRFLALLWPRGALVFEADSPYGPALTVRAGRRLMSDDALAAMIHRIESYSKGLASVEGCDSARYFALDAFGNSEACILCIHKGDWQFDVRIRGEEYPPDWFTEGWKFL